MNKEIKILKVKINGDETATITYDEIITDDELDPVINHHTIDGGNRIHKDLARAMRQLDCHCGLVCEQIQPMKGKAGTSSQVEEDGTLISLPTRLSPEDAGILATMRANGFSISGDGDKEAVTITATRKLKSGHALSITSPAIRYEGGKQNYKFTQVLAEDVELISREAEEYLNGKCAPNPQLEMFNEPGNQ